MKVYPDNHIIQAKEKTTVRDIPLAYIENKKISSDLRIDYNPDFIKPTVVKPVNIYQKFYDPDTYFFDKNRKKVAVDLKRVGHEYLYSPKVTEFTPESFSWKAILKRNGRYESSTPYNIRIGVVENSILSDNFLYDLNSIFSDASKRDLCPGNITVNGNSEDPNSLINQNYKNCDFLFVGSSTGTGSIKSGNNTISINDILDSNCNIWMAVNSFAPILKTTSSETKDTTCALVSSLLYNQTQYTIKSYPYYFDMDTVHEAYPLDDFQYINLFNGICPILLLKKEHSGFIILSEKDFFIYIKDNAKLIYEIMMYVYLNSYCHTASHTSWITDIPIQYYLNLHNKYEQNHPEINLSDTIRKDGISLKAELILDYMDTSDNITYLGVDNKSRLFFAKKEATDPAIPNNAATILSENNTVLVCTDTDVITTVEEKINLSYVKTATGYKLIVQPYKSSSLQLDTDYMEFTIPDDNQEYILYVDTDDYTTSVTSTIKLTSAPLYQGQGITIATIQIIKESILNVYDLRQLGGGEADTVPNYEMIDEGNILGRPYRLGSTLIIKVPKHYIAYKDLIQQELDKNISSGEIPVLIFEGN